MLDRTYKSLYDKIEPPDYLIVLTKEKMKKEKNKKHFSFYKYGAIAACFIIAIVVAIPYTKTINNVEFAGNAPMQSTSDSLSSSQIWMEGNFSGTDNLQEDLSSKSEASFESIPQSTGNAFSTNTSIGNASKDNTLVPSKSLGEKIIDFIKSIILLPIKLIQTLIDFFTF